MFLVQGMKRLLGKSLYIPAHTFIVVYHTVGSRPMFNYIEWIYILIDASPLSHFFFFQNEVNVALYHKCDLGNLEEII